MCNNLADVIGLDACRLQAPVFVIRTDQQGAEVPAFRLKLICLQACYRVVEVAQRLWHSPHPKAKDYIVRPKANGYQSLHLTLTVATAAAAASAAAADGAALRSALEEDEVLPNQQEGAVFLELQIRTQGGHSIRGCSQ